MEPKTGTILRSGSLVSTLAPPREFVASLALSHNLLPINNPSKRLKDWPIQLRDELEQWSSFHNLLGGHLGKMISAEKEEAERDEINGTVSFCLRVRHCPF